MGGVISLVGPVSEEKDFDDTEQWCELDEVTGLALDPKLVKAAEDEEAETFEEYDVWSSASDTECETVTGKRPIPSRHVYLNKGDSDNPIIRARLVAQEVKKKVIESLFAGTPPLAALRLLISFCVTRGLPPEMTMELIKEVFGVFNDLTDRFPTGRVEIDPLATKGSRKIGFYDVRRAFHHARLRPSMRGKKFVKTPWQLGTRRCKRLKSAMYGTLTAANDWQREFADKCTKSGGLRGGSSACVYWFPELIAEVFCYGDNVVIEGNDYAIEKIAAELGSYWPLNKEYKLGPEPGDDREARCLNRLLTYESDGIVYESDPRHGEIIVRTLGFDNPNTKGSAVPGRKKGFGRGRRGHGARA
jgi:hypothetical protein